MLTVFKHRLIEPEVLDQANPDEARINLADLVRLNKLFGGHSTTRKLLARAVRPAGPFTLLDVGAASGDNGRYLGQLYPAARITSLDYNQVNLEAASSPKLIADAFALPFGDGSFNYVYSSLFLHHFTNEDVVQLLSEFLRVARQAVLIVDLERHIIPYCFLPASRLIFGWNRITVHDGVISVRAAFKARELEALAGAAGIKNVTISVHRPAFRIAMLGWKSGSLKPRAAAESAREEAGMPLKKLSIQMEKRSTTCLDNL